MPIFQDDVQQTQPDLDRMSEVGSRREDLALESSMGDCRQGLTGERAVIYNNNGRAESGEFTVKPDPRAARWIKT